MKKLYSLWDVYKYPLVLLFIAALMKGAGSLLLNSGVLNLLPEGYIWLERVFESARYLGVFMEKLFPLFFLVRYISCRFEDSFPVLNGIIGYFVMNIVMMFYGPFNLPLHQYNASLGMSWTTVYGNVTTVKYPLFIGVLGALVIGWIVSFTYKKSRKRFAYGLFGFINNDIYSLLNASIWAIVAGFAFSYGWAYFLKGIRDVMEYIAADIYNPSNLFLYGFMEQILSVFGLQDILHEPFWFGTLGGSWMDNFGKYYTGDITLWTTFAQMNTAYINYGRFTTPYYLTNFFVIPSILIAIYTLTTDKLKRRKTTGLMIVAVLTSLFSGYLWPLNIFLALSAPALFFIHTIAVSLMYALLPLMKVMMGYTYTGTLENAVPGNILSFLQYAPNPNYSAMAIRLVIIGVILFVFYFLITRTYYRHITGEFLDNRKDEKFANEVIEALGGTSNIRFVNSTFDNLTVYLYDPSRMNNTHLIELGAYRIINTRAGIDLQFGPKSSHLRLRLNEAIKKYMEEQQAKPVVTSNDLHI